MAKTKDAGTGRLAGKVAMVTGAAEGIGRATAGLFAEKGAKVVLADMNREAGEAAVREISGQGYEAVFGYLDVSREENWAALMADTLGRWGKLNILVNNAGISQIADVENTTLADFQATLAVNTVGVFLGIKHAIAAMKQNHELCSIVNRSSIDGLVAEPELFAYCASKGAVTTMSKSAALSCANRGYKIRVNSVHPAYVHTSMTKGEAAGYGIEADEYMRRMQEIHPLGLGEALDVAYMDLFLASDESKWVTGAAFTIDGGVTAQ